MHRDRVRWKIPQAPGALPLLAPVALLVGTALLYCWHLDVSGFANPYYSAAAQAGSTSWKAFLFGSLDASNAITVDKPPLALWPIDLSVRVFGLSSWSVLLPQAIEGTCAVGLLYACVRRTTGEIWPALGAGALFAIMPVSVLVFRYNNPDAMLTLLLVGAAYATLRSVERPHQARWIVLAGLLVGLAFLAKMLAAFLVLPALWCTYVVFAGERLRSRVVHLAYSGAAVAVGAGWWIALVELWPSGRRPFIGGSAANSVLELAVGYNGVSRLTGTTSGMPSRGLSATNIARIVRTDVGGEIGWFLPAACLLLVATSILVARADREGRRPERAALVLWGSWLLVTTVTFGLMEGIFHSYYTVVMAPAVSALVATGGWWCWRARRQLWVRRLLATTASASAVVAGGTVAVAGTRYFVAATAIAVCGCLAAVVLARTASARTTAGATVVAVAALLSGPLLYDGATISAAHAGSGPMAGPGHGVASDPSGDDQPIGDGVEDALEGDASTFRWVAAAPGARSASAYQLAVGAPVLAIGGYKGTDPLPDLQTFIAMVDAGQIHWFIQGGTYGLVAQEIQDWVVAHFPPTEIEGRKLYELA